MVYLFESKLPENKSIYLGLKQIYGVGSFNSKLICKKLGFSFNFKVKNLSNNQITKISFVIKSLNLTIANELKKLNSLNKKNLLNIKSYKGLRRNQGFPIRGQRTHTNAKTSKKIR